MAKKKQESKLDYNLLLKAVLLISQKIEVLTEEVRLLKKELNDSSNKEGTN
jgi:uncharacterized small protein (DUF1192 family)